jgi:thiol-disulfide isomerase/thioredoxin
MPGSGELSTMSRRFPAMEPRRVFALITVVGGMALLAWTFLEADDGHPSPTETAAAPTSTLAELEETPPQTLGPVETLTGLDGWLNTDAESFEDIRAESRVVVVHFWTLGCSNCKKTLPYLRRLYADFGGQGLEIVGVHAPEFSYEAELDNITAAIDEHEITWPVALDTNKRNFHRWQEGPTAYWPRAYLIDADGQIRQNERGDGQTGYDDLYRNVAFLLAEDT